MSVQLLLLGPAMGPIAGGYIAQTVGVKWVFIVISSLSYPFYHQRNLSII
jgi:MFS family permease